MEEVVGGGVRNNTDENTKTQNQTQNQTIINQTEVQYSARVIIMLLF